MPALLRASSFPGLKTGGVVRGVILEALGLDNAHHLRHAQRPLGSPRNTTCSAS